MTIWTRHRLAELTALWAGDWSADRIAAHMGMSVAQVMDARQRYGLPARARRCGPRERKAAPAARHGMPDLPRADAGGIAWPDRSRLMAGR